MFNKKIRFFTFIFIFFNINFVFASDSLLYSSQEENIIFQKEVFYQDLISKAENELERNINICLYAYEILYLKKDFGIPKDVLYRELNIAQKIQESGNDIDVDSGIWQLTNISIKDVFGYNDSLSFLDELRNSYKIYFFGSTKLSKNSFQKLKNFLKENPDHKLHSAIRYLYLTKLWLCDNEVRGSYGIGRKYYKRGQKKLASDYLLAAYNAGCSIKREDPFDWPQVTQNYIRNIRRIEKIIKKIIKEDPLLTEAEIIEKLI